MCGAGSAASIVGTFAVRAILVLLLAQQLRTLALFPLAFGVLVVAKTYTVGRNALVPLLVETDDDLVTANARLSRTASIAGTIAGAAAVAVYTTAGGAWTLRLAAVVYVLGAVAAWSVRKVLPAAEAARRTDIVELLRVDFSGAVWDMMALRAAVGYAMFHFALLAARRQRTGVAARRRDRRQQRRRVPRHGGRAGDPVPRQRATHVHLVDARLRRRDGGRRPSDTRAPR